MIAEQSGKQNSVLVAISLIGTLAFSWLYMQWTHEFGHILTGLATGAELDRVILNPLKFSMTQFASNPRPHITTWGGPVLGVLIGAGVPMLLICLIKRHQFSLRIVAAFVLLANGLYIGLGAITPFADAQELIEYGSPRWLLAVFGLVCCIAARAILAPVLNGPSRLPTRREQVLYALLMFTLAALGFLIFNE